MQVYTWYKRGENGNWNQINGALVLFSTTEEILNALDQEVLSIIKEQNAVGLFPWQPENLDGVVYDKLVFLHQPYTGHEFQRVIEHPRFIHRDWEINLVSI